MRSNPSRPTRLSIVVPLLDEADSLRPLHGEVVDAMEGAGIDWELVFVDDGSRDVSPQVLKQLSRVDPRVRVVTLNGNYGQSAATIAGAEAARGDWVATLDADGQNDPRDLVRMWTLIADGCAEGVLGVRTERRDSWVRRVASRIANGARNRLLGDTTTDVGCSTRILPRRALLDVPRFEGMHRFLPLLVRSLGYRLVEIPVGHRPRLAGRSKYGINNRLWCGLADLLMLRRLLRRSIGYSVRSPARVAEAMGAEDAGTSPGAEAAGTARVSVSLEQADRNAPRGTTRTWRLQAAGLLAAALLLATREAGRAPLEYHEAYVVETALEMEQRGDWVVPWFNGEPRLRKPPLSYWLTALSGRLRGEDGALEPIDGRLPSALAGAGIVALVLILGTRLYDRRTGALAAVMTITSLGFFHYTHSARTDMLYAFWCTAGLAAFVASWRAEEEGRGGWRTPLLGWVCFAFATLAKGPHVPAMFLLAFGVWAAIEKVPPRKLLGWLRPGAGLALYLALSLPWWLVLDGRLGGGGLRGTQLGGSLLRLGPPAPDYLYRLPQLLVPWFLMAPVVLALEWRRRVGGRATKLLGAIVATTVLLFSLGPQQRMFYVLPLLAPSLLLIAAGALRVLRDHPSSRLERMVAWSGALVLALLAAGTTLPLAGFHPASGLPPDTVPRLAAALVGVITSGLLFLAGVRRGRPAESSVAATALASALVFWTLGGPLSEWSKSRTTDPGLAREAARLSEGTVRTWSIFPDLYVYYAGRPVAELESAGAVLRALDDSPETGMVLIAREGELSRLPATVGVEVIERSATLKDPDVVLVRLTRRPPAVHLAGTGPGHIPRSARPAP